MELNLAKPLETPPPEDIFIELEKQGKVLLAEAMALQIVDAAGEAKAAGLFLRAKDHLKFVKKIVHPFVEASHKKWKEDKDRENKYNEPAERVVAILNPRLAAYNAEKERKRRAEEARLQEEQRKKAEEEKLQEAIAAEQMGQPDVAENILNAPTYIPTAVVPKAPAAAGVSYVDYWSAEVTDLMTLVLAVAAGKASIAYLQANVVALNEQARSLKETFNIPGCKAVKESKPKDGRR